MLRLSSAQRFVEKLLDTANLAMAGLVFGQFVANQVFSYGIAVLGFAAWIALVRISLFISKGD